jgi:hypothetical protein
MSNVVECTIKHFEGKVTLSQPLYLEQVWAFENAEDNASEFEPAPSALLTRVAQLSGKKDEDTEPEAPVVKAWSSRIDALYIPAIVKCVEKVEIKGQPEKFTEQNFPMSPRLQSSQFIGFLVDEIRRIYSGELEIPNES